MSNFLRRLATGIKDFVYNVSRGQYETASGQVVPDERVIAASEGRLNDGSQVVDTLWSQYVNGDITARELQDDFAVELRRLHSQEFALGRGGWDAVTIADRQIIEARLRDELAFLRELADEARRGNLSDAELKRRLDMYVNDTKTSYWEGKTEGQKDTGMTKMRRVLNPAEHCTDCEGYAALGFVPIGDLPMPGDGSRCMSNCVCEVEYA